MRQQGSRSLDNEIILHWIQKMVSRLDNFTQAAVVSDRYHIFSELFVTGSTQQLYRFNTEIIHRVGTVVKSKMRV
jgi:hypothetical protein